MSMEQPGEYGLIERIVRLETALAYERELMLQTVGQLSQQVASLQQSQPSHSSPGNQITLETWAKIFAALILPPLVLLLTGGLDWAMRAARLVAL